MRKTDYIPRGTQEAFIVPLLAREISHALTEISSLIAHGELPLSFRALDCGCGNQPFRTAILGHGFHYESLDVAQNSMNNVDYICALDESADIFSTKISNPYSLLLVTEVLEHVSNWHAAFVNIALAMEAGGYALLTAPFFYPLHEEPHDYCRPTVHQFMKVSRAAGLEVISISKCGGAVDVIGTILGATRIQYSSPNRVLNRVVNSILARLQALMFICLFRYRDNLKSECETIYLSNVIILQKVSSQ
jgi:hypothetical protein